MWHRDQNFWKSTFNLDRSFTVKYEISTSNVKLKAPQIMSRAYMHSIQKSRLEVCQRARA